ncbi:MAG: acyl-CoA dehydrogenase family protein [Alphaproteobacteria bacterium]|jgi:hypothetical protein|nr:acyl-CoA dehydrogenase family protein [Alphaproteobacteria bacterium]HJP23115.1 acyl-CoA dehydrogenase family protein [Alphaproteobacteria bacterium]
MSDVLLSPEELQFRDSVHSFVEREIAPNATKWDLGERYPRELFPVFAELGWMGVAFPEEVGGSGGGSALYAILCRELARGSAAIALGLYVHTALASSGILHLGSEAQRKRWLPAAMKGEKIGCWAYAEAGAGSDVSAVSTRAQADGNGWVLNGSKLYITNATFADFMIVVASSNPELGLKGLSLFVVEADNPGVSVGAPMNKLGMGASEMGEIVFDDCRLPGEALLGPTEGGFIQALKVLVLGRIAASGFSVGLGRAALEEATSYTRQRVQFGKPLVGQQFVRFTLADMATRLEAAWQLTLHAARLVDAGQPFDREASMAKLFASEASTWACERTLHLCGAQGFMRESNAQRFYRDCKVNELGEGTSEIQRENIARMLVS